MSDERLTTGDAWRARYPKGQVAPGGDWFRPELRTDSVLLFSAATGGETFEPDFGVWQWFRSPRELAAYLRHVWLPESLAERRGGSEPRTLVERQLEAGVGEDGFLIDLCARLDAVEADEAAWSAIEALAAAVRERWAVGEDPRHRLDVFRTLTEAAPTLYHRLAAGEWSFEDPDDAESRREQDRERKGWLALCSRVDRDADARSHVTEQLVDADDQMDGHWSEP